MKLVLSLFVLCITTFGFAQVTSNDILFTVDNEPVKAEEFIRVYNKNLDLVKDESQKDIDAYLKLFVNYQLKIKEAKRLGFDKNPNYLSEFSNYKGQLTKNYLSDSKVTDALMKEAYERMKYDVKASHILIRLDESEKDTLEVYNKLLALRDRVIKEGFEKVKNEVHNGKTIFAEDLGYFSAFKMVYEFENAAYNTKVGEISMPFRTKFGYHIISVEDKRPSLGEVTVEHIMVANNPKDSLFNPETRIKEIYKKINQGENFESLARQFSDDKSSSGKGGLLAPFTGGQLSSQEFEDVAFSLKEKGDISKPFKSNYGWHIIKLIDKKGVPPFDEIKLEIESKVKRDSRSSLINTSLANTLKKKYDVKENLDALPYFESILTPAFYNRSWVLPDGFEKDKLLFKIQDHDVTYNDFGNYLMGLQKVYSHREIPFKTIVEKEFKSFEESTILKYHEDHLEYENEDFAQILKEYRDGLLLFDLMEKEVWNAAVTDTIGQQKFYDTHKDDYVWQNRIDAIIASAAKETDIHKVETAFKAGKTSDKINTKLNTEKEQHVIFTKGVFEADYQALPKDLELKKGLSKVYHYNDAFHVIWINEVIPSTNKTFEEAKGRVISDYQNDIEATWLQSLNDRYKVEVNADVLAKVKAQIQHQN